MLIGLHIWGAYIRGGLYTGGVSTGFYGMILTVQKLTFSLQPSTSWLEANRTRLDMNKCSVMIFGYVNECLWAKVWQDKIWEIQY